MKTEHAPASLSIEQWREMGALFAGAEEKSQGSETRKDEKTEEKWAKC